MRRMIDVSSYPRSKLRTYLYCHIPSYTLWLPLYLWWWWTNKRNWWTQLFQTRTIGLTPLPLPKFQMLTKASPTDFFTRTHSGRAAVKLEHYCDDIWSYISKDADFFCCRFIFQATPIPPLAAHPMSSVQSCLTHKHLIVIIFIWRTFHSHSFTFHNLHCSETACNEFLFARHSAPVLTIDRHFFIYRIRPLDLETTSGDEFEGSIASVIWTFYLDHGTNQITFKIDTTGVETDQAT